MLKPSFYIEEAFNKTPEEVQEFFRERMYTIFSTVPIRENCADVLQTLWDQGNTIHLITARDEAHRAITETWLKRHGLRYHSLHMSPPKQSYSKGELSAQLGVHFFVDDKKENAIDVASQGIYTLLYHASHNHDYKGTLPRVYNWQEVQEHIHDFFEQGLDQVSRG